LIRGTLLGSWRNELLQLLLRRKGFSGTGGLEQAAAAAAATFRKLDL